MILNKKITFFEKLSEFIGKPKDISKALKSPWLPNCCKVSALKIIQLHMMLTQFYKVLKIIIQLGQKTFKNAPQNTQ